MPKAASPSSKYESAKGSTAVVDVHPRVVPLLGNPRETLYISEGVKKGDAGTSNGILTIALLGVWNWRGANDAGGTTALPDWEYIAFKHKDGTPREVRIVFDSDVVHKEGVKAALKRFVRFLTARGANVTVIYLPGGPNGEKVGLDDYFVNGGTVEGLDALAKESAERENAAPEPRPLTSAELRAEFQVKAADIAPTCSLEGVIAAFRRYLYIEDDSIILVVLAVVVANLMDGDPVWLLLVGASSGGKTEFLNPLSALPGAHQAAHLTEASLLSGSSARERAAHSKGGLLRVIGQFGFLFMKDFTSVLAMNREASTSMLAALREIYDGSWTRHVGTDGGQTLSWQGKLGIIACCTEAIDKHHAVNSAMGERFVNFRLPVMARQAMTRRALLSNTSESEMREALQQAVVGFFAGLEVPGGDAMFDETELERLVNLADLATRCRSAVQRDSYSRGVDMVPEPEYPVRFAKILHRLFSAMLTIGVSRERAWGLVTKIALDSMHKNRRQILGQVLAKGEKGATIVEIEHSVLLSGNTVRRALEDLRAHQLVRETELVNPNGQGGSQRVYQLSPTGRALLEAVFVGRDWEECVAQYFPARAAEPYERGGLPVSFGHRPRLSEKPGRDDAPRDADDALRERDDDRGDEEDFDEEDFVTPVPLPPDAPTSAGGAAPPADLNGHYTPEMFEGIVSHGDGRTE